MRFTINRIDNLVGVNQEFKEVSLSSLPANIRVVQWLDTIGHIEYLDGSPNTIISDITPFNSILTLWYNQVSPPLKTVSPAQIRLVLLKNNLLDSVEKLVASSSKAVQVEWEFRTEYERTNPLLCYMASLLGLNDQQIDDLFLAASSL